MSNDERPQVALNMVELHNRLLKLEKDTGDHDNTARVRLALLERRAEALEVRTRPVRRHDTVAELEKRIRETAERLANKADRDEVARVRERVLVLERRADQNANLRERLELAVQRFTGASPVARADKVADLEKRIRELEMRITPVRHDGAADTVAELEKRVGALAEDEYRHMFWPTAGVTRQEPAEESLPEHARETYARYLDTLITWGARGALLTSGEAAVLDSIRKKLRGTMG